MAPVLYLLYPPLTKTFLISSSPHDFPTHKNRKNIKKETFSRSLARSLMASLQSPVASPVPQLVIATTPDSLSKNVLFVDFVGLYCKSKRTRRRIGLSSSFSRFSNKKNSRLNAILSVDRQSISPPSPTPPPDLKPQVVFFCCLFNLFCCLR